MRSIGTLYKELKGIIKEEGFLAGLKAILRFFTNAFLNLRYQLLIRYYNTFHHGLILRKIQGNKMYLSTSDSGLSLDLLFRDIREPLQTNLVKQLLKPGMTVVDIGANLGYYVLIEASIIGEGGKVYAIEPVPSSYEILKKNVSKNGYEGIVETHHLAISDSNGTSRIAIARQRNASTMFLTEDEMSEAMKEQLENNVMEIVDVAVVSLDNFLKNRNAVDFIRMDVEGYEGRIVKGMSETVKNARKGLQLFMELHPCIFKEPNITVAEIFQDLTALGLRAKYIVNTEGTELLDFSSDNLLEVLCREWAPGLFMEKI